MSKWDVLYFNGLTIEVHKSSDAPAVTSLWGTGCQPTGDGLSGIRSLDERPFLIQSDSEGRLTCTFLDNSQGRIRAMSLGTVLGTVAGALAGLAAGAPLLGSLIGFIASLTGSATTSATAPEKRGESGGTYVAQDGNGVRIATSESQPLKAVG